MKNKTIRYAAIFVTACSLCVLLLTSFRHAGHTAKQQKVLIYSKTNGYRHESIEAGIEAIKNLGKTNNFIADATEDSLDINDKKLSNYKAIIFLSTTAKVLGEPEEKALQNFIRKGNGFVGIHAATDCEYNFPWYVEMVGASFLSHPAQQIAQLQVVDNTHQSTKHLPLIWERKDEWYNFKSINPAVKVLIKIDESSYEGGKNNGNHPMAWYHDFDGGRAFYTELGHTKESYADSLYLRHIAGGINYALGQK